MKLDNPPVNATTFVLDLKQFFSALKQIAEEKGIPEESVFETIEAAIAAAYKRDYGKKGQIIRAKLDAQTGQAEMTQVYYVVEGVDEEGYVTGSLPEALTEERPDIADFEPGKGRPHRIEQEIEKTAEGEIRIKFNPEKHITLTEAQKRQSGIDVGQELVVKLEGHMDFGRIAAQVAKQVVIQRLREAERGAIFSEFKKREGELISGMVQRREGLTVLIDLGKTNGLIAPAEQVPGDNYRIGQRFRSLILKVEETSRGPVVLLSRSHPKLVQELFRVEVPEIENGGVEIKAIAREAGSRTKVAVTSHDDGIDPIGSLVGQKGVRVQTVINELSGEKIDIILWSEKPEDFISQALSPAKVLKVTVVDADKHHALAEVTEDQFSLAIGKRGQNVRLAAKLTGWRIDVRSPKENLDFSEASDSDQDILKGDSGEATPATQTESPGDSGVSPEATNPEAEELLKEKTE